MVEVVENVDGKYGHGWSVFVCGKEMFWYEDGQLAMSFASELERDEDFRAAVQDAYGAKVFEDVGQAFETARDVSAGLNEKGKLV